MLACNEDDGKIYEWQLGTGTPAAVLSNAPTSNLGCVVTEERFLFALGAGGNPLCVLDEVDAPLDDANVTRFCDLLDEMCRRTDTRFLIITHHAVTMARMDRLFGVTMQEQGVSQLVSVDLKKAESLVA